MIKNIITFIIFTHLLLSCSAAKEGILPFKNYNYSGDRLFPIQTSNAKKTFRIWINNSTSIDRILTVSQGSSFGDQSNLVEIGYLYKGERKIKFYNEIDMLPKSGIENFFKRLDSLNLMGEKNRDEISVALHQPKSFYVIEYKNEDRYKQFSFKTAFPNEAETKTKYEAIESLILDEFILPIYIK